MNVFLINVFFIRNFILNDGRYFPYIAKLKIAQVNQLFQLLNTVLLFTNMATQYEMSKDSPNII